MSPTTTAVTLIEPLPGLPQHTRFTFAPVPQAPDLYTLRADDLGDGHQPRLFLLDPREFFPDYQPIIDPQTLNRLGSTEPRVLVVLHPATGDLPHTANLLAPVLVDTSTGAAVQVVLENSPWPVRAPLTAAA